jgi:hypothetical protein
MSSRLARSILPDEVLRRFDRSLPQDAYPGIGAGAHFWGVDSRGRPTIARARAGVETWLKLCYHYPAERS